MKYLIILFLFLNNIAFPQNLSIKGKVVDSETLLPLPAANLIIVGKSIGVAAQNDGSFTLSGNFYRNDTLKVSYVGYLSKLITLENADLENS